MFLGWRPPYGDVDDRVRAIAWQMGMQNILWDQDTNDWDMPGEGGGKLLPSKVDSYFKGWIDASKKGTDKTGHIVLEHELNNATVKMIEKWLPSLQENFEVVSIQQCMNVSQPYWESNWVYPTMENNTTAPITNTTSDVPSTTTIILSSSAIPSSTSAAETSPSTTISSANSALNAEKAESSAASLNVVYGTSLLTAAAAYAAYYL